MAEDGFLQRWSRRKASAGAGVPDVPATTPAPLPPVISPMGGGPPAQGKPLANTGSKASTAACEAHAPDRGAAQPTTAPTAEPPPPTLADTQGLTPASDFRPFMGQGVAPEVKNAAMKKLFADPHFNVMDRMDIYIDDYSQPDPLPLAMLRQMNGAKFLSLFEDEGQDPNTPKLNATPAPDGLPPAVSPAQGHVLESASAHTPPVSDASIAKPAGAGPVSEGLHVSPPPSADTACPADALPGHKT